MNFITDRFTVTFHYPVTMTIKACYKLLQLNTGARQDGTQSHTYLMHRKDATYQLHLSVYTDNLRTEHKYDQYTLL